MIFNSTLLNLTELIITYSFYKILHFERLKDIYKRLKKTLLLTIYNIETWKSTRFIKQNFSKLYIFTLV